MEKPRIGIQGIESAVWGEHICVFFNTKDELLNRLQIALASRAAVDAVAASLACRMT